MEGLEFNASLGQRAGDRGLKLITMAMCNTHTHNTQVGVWVVIFRLLPLFPKLSVPAVLIVGAEVELCMCVCVCVCVCVCLGQA